MVGGHDGPLGTYDYLNLGVAVPPVPILLVTMSPNTLRLAGRIADGLICTSGKGAELYTETLLPALEEGAAKAERDPAAAALIQRIRKVE